jgi:hypothetical protein
MDEEELEYLASEYGSLDEAAALSIQLRLAEEAEAFMEKGGVGALMVRSLKDDMVTAYQTLFDSNDPVEIMDAKVAIKAYRLLTDMLTTAGEFLVNERSDIRDRDREFLRRLTKGDTEKERPDE